MIQISTQRLSIRDPLPADLPGWHRLFSNTQNMRFVEQLQCHSLDESRASLQRAVDAVRSRPRVEYFFAVELAQSGEFIGSIGFTAVPAGDDLLGGSGWFLLPEHQGKGYAAESFAALIPHMFRDWRITRVDAGCNADNEASRRVMQKCGMSFVKRQEGRLQYQLTKEDWEAKNMITYRGTHDFIPQELQELFLSVEWSSGHYPEKLAAAMRNFGTVYSAWGTDAVGNERLVGLISAMDDGVMTAYVHYLLVHPEYQHQGIGRRLVEMTRENYRDYLRVVVVAYNAELDFYESCGFKKAEDASPMFITSLWT